MSRKSTNIDEWWAQGKDDVHGTAVEDLVNYRVLGVLTKSYNKWMLCDIGRQA
jgi:hypothetical protein